MADFLTRLVERTLCLAPKAEPIISSMFVPRSVIENDNLPGLLDDELQSFTVKENQLVLSRSPLKPSPLEAQSKPSHPKESDSQYTPHHHSESTSLKQVKDGVLSLGVPAPDPVSSDDSPSGKLPAERSSISTEPVAVKTLPKPEQLGSQLPVPTVETQTGTSEPSSDLHSLVSLQVDGNEKQAATLSTSKPSSMVVRPRITSYNERIGRISLEHPTSPPESATSPSAIQVTIGRVEVRAITPPAPQAPQNTLTPALSLDDYLKQRNEGWR